MSKKNDYLKYTGTSPVQVGDKILLPNPESDDFIYKRTVGVVLATQFITTKGEFRFNTDRGLTWKKART